MALSLLRSTNQRKTIGLSNRSNLPQFPKAGILSTTSLVTAVRDKSTFHFHLLTEGLSIRRLSYDLIGLPPTPEQLATPADRIEDLVEHYLASPQYGERWARHWLDVARYSDAKDGVLMYGDARIRPFAYTYRDYVIRAFNQDRPFDDFIREQLAADQLGLPTDSPRLAGMYSNLGTTIRQQHTRCDR